MGFELELDWHYAGDARAADRALEQRLARCGATLYRARQACARLRDLPAGEPERIAARLAYAQAAQRCRELEDALCGLSEEPDGDERG
jgi:hypothetical protein